MPRRKVRSQISNGNVFLGGDGRWGNPTSYPAGSAASPEARPGRSLTGPFHKYRSGTFRLHPPASLRVGGSALRRGEALPSLRLDPPARRGRVKIGQTRVEFLERTTTALTDWLFVSLSEPRDVGRLCDRSHRVPAWIQGSTRPLRWQDSLRVAAHTRTPKRTLL